MGSRTDRTAHTVPAANWGGVGREGGGHRYLVESGGNKFSTSGVDSFHNHNLKDRQQTGLHHRGDEREVWNKLL